MGKAKARRMACFFSTSYRSVSVSDNLRVSRSWVGSPGIRSGCSIMMLRSTWLMTPTDCSTIVSVVDFYARLVERFLPIEGEDNLILICRSGGGAEPLLLRNVAHVPRHSHDIFSLRTSTDNSVVCYGDNVGINV